VAIIPAAPDRTTLVAFSATVLFGGGNFVAAKFSNVELPPLFGAGVRFAAASLIFLLLVRLRGMPLPRGKAASGALLYGMLFGTANGLAYTALLGVTAGTVAVIYAMVPLLALVLAVIVGQERFNSWNILGGAVAVLGIAVFSIRSLAGDVSILFLLVALGGAAAAAASSVVAKSFPRSDPITTNFIGMLAAATTLAVGSLAFREKWVLPVQAETWIALSWLATVGSVGLFGLFIFIIRRWTASATMYALALMPIVAATLGVVLAAEKVTAELVGGGILVLAGVYVGAIKARQQTGQRHAASGAEPHCGPIEAPAGS
jgi:drug/metabolite transporter (DMT)-like permease